MVTSTPAGTTSGHFGRRRPLRTRLSRACPQQLANPTYIRSPERHPLRAPRRCGRPQEKLERSDLGTDEGRSCWPSTWRGSRAPRRWRLGSGGLRHQDKKREHLKARLGSAKAA